MLKRVLAVAVVILAVMIAVKDARILKTTGLTGTCSVVQASAGSGPDLSEIAACKAGKLEGRPDLSHRGCKRVGRSGTTDYWRCPVGFDVSDAGKQQTEARRGA